MRFPTYEEMAKNVAEKALDEYVYQGKTLREWIQIILESQDEDCISRKQAIKELKDYFADGEGIVVGEYWLHDKVIEVLDNLPSVTPQPKTGHWIEWHDVDGALHGECSECGKQYNPYTVRKYNYCPNCGARMVEPQERSDKE